MKHYLVAERYAAALSKAVPDDVEIDAVAAGLHELAAALDASDELHKLLENPAIPFERRQAIVHQVIDAADPPLPVRKLAEVMLQRGRIVHLPETATVFQRIADQRKNRVGAVVTSAVALDDRQSTRMQEALAAWSGSNVRISFRVDPDILGGVVAEIGSTIIDGSVRSQLRRLEAALLSEERSVE